MGYNRSSTREKWTIMKYMHDFNLMTTYAYALREANELTNENINDILGQMIDEGIYNPRYGGSIDTGKFKIIQIAWYMFGYYDNTRRSNNKKRLVFSPLGNLLLDNLKDKNKVSKIFLAMLFGNAFRQPFSKMDNRYNIFAYRLVFQLLRDPRLHGRLYHDEIFYFAMFLKTVTRDTYEKLVNDILQFRTKSAGEKYNIFKRDEPVIAQALHEWNYATGILETAGIIKVCNDSNGKSIGVLIHGNGSGRRTYREDYIIVKPEIAAFMDKMLYNYPYDQIPFSDEERAQSFDNEMVVKMYSFYPIELLQEIGIDMSEQEKISKLLKIATSVNEYATNQNADDFNRFEVALRDAFRLFRNVKAENIGGAGNTDVECIYYPDDEQSAKKFDVEAKARKVKLMEISAGRLRLHREKIGSKYTVIVTPDYVHAVLDDIRGERVAIIKSVTLSNYLFQYITKYGRDISYFALDEIIENNLGGDVTHLVNDYIYANFGHGYAI
ncbi:type II restriction enzyme [Neobacillus niacini]|uniref:hypothetical protein n=1 Tax=Neobacillus niacini TaxID=86668 RepID=UPI0028655829|nr:hypothetical protein [Neobacillus niacini]MDR7079884.1 type II restriction enzyme [Neobacillus niacini]